MNILNMHQSRCNNNYKQNSLININNSVARLNKINLEYFRKEFLEMQNCKDDDELLNNYCIFNSIISHFECYNICDIDKILYLINNENINLAKILNIINDNIPKFKFLFNQFTLSFFKEFISYDNDEYISCIEIIIDNIESIKKLFQYFNTPQVCALLNNSYIYNHYQYLQELFDIYNIKLLLRILPHINKQKLFNLLIQNKENISYQITHINYMYKIYGSYILDPNLPSQDPQEVSVKYKANFLRKDNLNIFNNPYTEHEDILKLYGRLIDQTSNITTKEIIPVEIFFESNS